MEISLKGICYLEQVNGSIGIFEFILVSEISNIKHILNNEAYHIHMSLTSIKKKLIKNYYYDFTISSEFIEGGSRIYISDSPNLLEMLGNRLNHNYNDGHLYINFIYNQEINLLTKQYIDAKSTIVKRTSKVLSFLAEGTTINNSKFNEFDIAAYRPIRPSLERYINQLIDERVEFDLQDEENIKRALKEISPYLNFNKWKDNRLSLYDLSYHLGNIKQFIESSNAMDEDEFRALYLPDQLEEIINFPGIGLTVMSTILSVLWKDRFIVYNPSFSLYMQRLGYKINNYKSGRLYTGKGKGLNSDKRSKVHHYLSYNTEVLQIINSSHEFFNIEPKFDIISTNIRKNFDMLEMLFE